MTDSNQAALNTLLQQWFGERQQALREQVLPRSKFTADLAEILRRAKS